MAVGADGLKIGQAACSVPLSPLTTITPLHTTALNGPDRELIGGLTATAWTIWVGWPWRGVVRVQTPRPPCGRDCVL